MSKTCAHVLVHAHARTHTHTHTLLDGYISQVATPEKDRCLKIQDTKLFLEALQIGTNDALSPPQVWVAGDLNCNLASAFAFLEEVGMMIVVVVIIILI